MKDMGRRFEADKVLMERDYHTSLLVLTDAAFERVAKPWCPYIRKLSMSLTVERACFCRTRNFSCAESMFWNKGRPTVRPLFHLIFAPI